MPHDIGFDLKRKAAFATPRHGHADKHELSHSAAARLSLYAHDAKWLFSVDDCARA